MNRAARILALLTATGELATLTGCGSSPGRTSQPERAICFRLAVGTQCRT